MSKDVRMALLLLRLHATAAFVHRHCTAAMEE